MKALENNSNKAEVLEVKRTLEMLDKKILRLQEEVNALNEDKASYLRSKERALNRLKDLESATVWSI